MSEDRIEEELQIAEEQAKHDARLEAAGLRRVLHDLPTLQPAVTCTPQATVRQAIETMQRERIGYVLIVDQDRLVGIFTERDVLTKVAAQDVDLDRTPVSALMTRDPECLETDNELVYALNQMSVGGYRHIPILNNQGDLVGVVSMRAIVNYLADLFPQDVLNLPPSPALGIPRTPEGA
jgi:CBS domain-containing protein